jgi:hypothetical protein
MVTSARVGASFLSAVVCVSCLYSVDNDGLRAKLETRAKFDLSCSKLALVPLEEDRIGTVISYGVIGCNRRVTYVLNGQGWVMNVSEGEPTGDAANQDTSTAPPIRPPVPYKP